MLAPPAPPALPAGAAETLLALRQSALAAQQELVRVKASVQQQLAAMHAWTTSSLRHTDAAVQRFVAAQGAFCKRDGPSM
jgi:hypothetical protein